MECLVARSRRALSLLAGVALAISGVGFLAGGTPGAGAAATPTVLLALGDSLAAGYQPLDGNHLPPVDSATGYRDQGYPNSYAADVAGARNLALTDLGCPGETTSSMVGTPAEPACASLYKAEFGASSQLAAAVAFLDRHPGQVAAVTLDIGANDLDRCASTSAIYYRCFANSESQLAKGLPAILGQVGTALHRDDPNARIVTMNYYDPFLGLADRPGGAQGVREASESLAAVNVFNAQLQARARLDHAALANVAGAYAVNAVLPLVAYAGKRLPKDVVETCQLTWMCSSGSQVVAADIHPNRDGYQVIASAFDRVLPATTTAG